LSMRGSRDEAYYWSSISKEKKMHKQIYRLKKEMETPGAKKKPVIRNTGKTDAKEGQTKLDSFAA